MDIRPIHTEGDYEWALAEIAPYFDSEPRLGTPEADRFDVLATLIAAYEDKHWPIEAPDPVSTVRETMALRGLTQATLATLLDSRSRASELLSGQRSITMAQAWKLHTEWGIPAEALIQPTVRAGRVHRQVGQ